MSSSNEEFARYAKAERQFCDQAGPVLDEIIRSIEARAGLRIAELRITVDWANRDDGSIMANCTIVRAHAVERSDDRGGPRSVRRVAPLNGASTSSQD
jgi:hypothetical protein